MVAFPKLSFYLTITIVLGFSCLLFLYWNNGMRYVINVNLPLPVSDYNGDSFGNISSSNYFNKYVTPYKAFAHSVPEVIIQYGRPRTGTTLQFEILCVMMILVHEKNAEEVECTFNAPPGTRYKVIKRHDLGGLFTNRFEISDSWMFMTSDAQKKKKRMRQELDLKAIIKKLKSKGIIIPLIVDLSVVRKQGYNIVNEYRPFFRLTNKQMTYVLQYFRLWDILRVCCGKQMSNNWRRILHGLNDTFNLKTDTMSTHTCARYDITDIEKSMLNSYIYKRFSNISTLRKALGRPSVVDDALDGTYCSRCNRNIVTHKLTMRDRCG